MFLGRVVAEGESQWLPEDRAKVLAFRLERGERCTKCGTAPWQWDADPDAFEPVVTRCMGCHRISVAREDVRDTTAEVTLVPQSVAARMRSQPRKRPKRKRGLR